MALGLGLNRLGRGVLGSAQQPPLGQQFLTVTDNNGAEQFVTVTDSNGIEQRITVATGLS